MTQQAEHIELKCLHCSKEFTRLPCQMTKSKRAFCSKDCFREYRQLNPPEHRKGECPTCGLKFMKVKIEQVFCSAKCYGATKRKRSIKTCPICRQTFEAFRGRRKFCSVECKHADQRKSKVRTVVMSCHGCGKVARKTALELQRHEEGATQHLFCSHACRMRFYASGARNQKWKGGVTHLRKRVRTLSDYKEWQLKVFKRDGFTCQLCSERGGNLHAHHAIPFAVLLESLLGLYPMLDVLHDAEVLADKARQFQPLWNKRNGITLCESCHDLVHGTNRKEPNGG